MLQVARLSVLFVCSAWHARGQVDATFGVSLNGYDGSQAVGYVAATNSAPLTGEQPYQKSIGSPEASAHVTIRALGVNRWQVIQRVEGNTQGGRAAVSDINPGFTIRSRQSGVKLKIRVNLSYQTTTTDGPGAGHFSTYDIRISVGSVTSAGVVNQTSRYLGISPEDQCPPPPGCSPATCSCERVPNNFSRTLIVPEMEGDSATINLRIFDHGGQIRSTLETTIEAEPVGDNLLFTSGQQNGIWVNADASRLEQGQWDHKTFISSLNKVSMNGNLTKSDKENGNEVVAFTQGKAMAFQENVDWTNGSDDLPVEFGSEIPLPLKVWILWGRFEEQAVRVATQVRIAATLFHNERLGMKPVIQGMENLTGPELVNELSQVIDFTCSWFDPPSSTQRSALERSRFYTPGVINVYFVRTVDKGNASATSCILGSGFIAMSKDVLLTTLAHELGHQIGLAHVNGVSQFDPSNLMWQPSKGDPFGGFTPRQFLSEGQIFRAHLSDFSIVNSLRLRRGPTRTCDDSLALNSTQGLGYLIQLSSTLKCPPVSKRIFPDGGLPSN